MVVIEQALARERLAHSLLLHGDDLDTLVLVARAIADRLLNEPAGTDGHFRAAKQHPDCFVLRPAGKMRQIVGAEAQPAELIRQDPRFRRRSAAARSPSSTRPTG